MNKESKHAVPTNNKGPLSKGIHGGNHATRENTCCPRNSDKNNTNITQSIRDSLCAPGSLNVRNR